MPSSSSASASSSTCDHQQLRQYRQHQQPLIIISIISIIIVIISNIGVIVTNVKIIPSNGLMITCIISILSVAINVLIIFITIIRDNNNILCMITMSMATIIILAITTARIITRVRTPQTSIVSLGGVSAALLREGCACRVSVHRSPAEILVILQCPYSARTVPVTVPVKNVWLFDSAR